MLTKTYIKPNKAKWHLVTSGRALLGTVITLLFVLAIFSSQGAFGSHQHIFCAERVAQRIGMTLFTSGVLKGERVGSIAHAKRIFEKARTSRALRLQMRAYLETIAPIDQLRNSPQFWDLYLSLYDLCPPHSSGFKELVYFANRYLPKSGPIADLGTGTGVFASRLSFWHPNRQIIALDFSKFAIKFAREKLEALNQFQTIDFITQGGVRGDLTRRQRILFRGQLLKGAVMNNVLYAIPHDKQLALLRMIYENLEEGGILVLMDINKDKIASASDLMRYFSKITYDAIRNGIYISDQQLALGYYINEIALAGHTPPFKTAEEIAGMLTDPSVGFRIKHKRLDMYLGASAAFVAEKPTQ